MNGETGVGPRWHFQSQSGRAGTPGSPQTKKDRVCTRSRKAWKLILELLLPDRCHCFFGGVLAGAEGLGAAGFAGLGVALPAAGGATPDAAL